MILTLLSNAVIYTDWFRREGDYAVFVAEALSITASTTVTIDVYHKSSNAESAMDGTSTGKSISLTAAGRGSVDMGASSAVALRELVRFKISCDVGSSNKWAIVSLLPPSWYNRGNG